MIEAGYDEYVQSEESELAVVDGWLRGIEALRQGVFTQFYIDGPDDLMVEVTPGNADEIERSLREFFGYTYPQLLN